MKNYFHDSFLGREKKNVLFSRPFLGGGGGGGGVGVEN